MTTLALSSVPFVPLFHHLHRRQHLSFRVRDFGPKSFFRRDRPKPGLQSSPSSHLLRVHCRYCLATLLSLSWALMLTLLILLTRLLRNTRRLRRLELIPFLSSLAQSHTCCSPSPPRCNQLLRSILHKKIYSQQQNCSRPTSMKKCLEDRKMPKKRNGDEAEDTAEIDGSKWVKTDSEYIVLEI